MTSPGSSGSTAESSATRRGTSKTSSLVAGILDLLAVDRTPDDEVVAVGELDGCHDPRAHRSVAAARLAERELVAGRELEMAVADVLTDREPSHDTPRVGRRHPVGAPADHGDELDFPVDGVADDLDVVERPSERRRELGERGRHIGDGHPGFGGMVAVVDSDREHLPGCGHRATQLGFDERRSSGRDA